jgi:hypothetical protein
MNRGWGEENGDGEEGELSDEVDKFLDSGLDSGDIEDGDDPDWAFEDGETRSSDPAYVFCPAPHRKPLLHLFTKHFCQHPVFPEQNDEARNATDIRKHAVMEMKFLSPTRYSSSVGIFLDLVVCTKYVETVGALYESTPVSAADNDGH